MDRKMPGVRKRPSLSNPFCVFVFVILLQATTATVMQQSNHEHRFKRGGIDDPSSNTTLQKLQKDIGKLHETLSRINSITSLESSVKDFLTSLDAQRKELQQEVKEKVSDKMENLIQLSNNFQRSLEDFQKQIERKEQDEAKKRLPDDTVRDIESDQFSEAEEKLRQANNGTYKYVVRKVYNNHVGNFELLLSFGDSIQDVDQKWKIYDALYYEMRTSGHNDTQKLLQLTQSIKNGIIDRTKGQAATAAQSLFDTLYAVTCCRPQERVVEDIFSAFVNDNSWPAVKKLSADMCENCYQTLVSIYDKVIEKLWNKVNLVDILARAQNNLKSLDERILIHQKIFNILIREEKLYTNSAISLARHMKPIMEDSTYKSLNSERRSQYEDIKNKLPPSVKNMVFLNQVCIQNIAMGRDYLGMEDTVYEYNKNHHLALTFKGRYFSQRGKVDFWKLHFLGDHQISIETRTGFFLKVTDDKTIDKYEKRDGYVSPVDESDQNYRWNIEFRKDGVLFKNNQYHDYFFVDVYSARDWDKQYTYTALDWRPEDGGGFWEITDCSNL